MPTPRQNFPNAGHFYSNIAKPTKLDLAFTVNNADAAGLGITSLKSNGYVRNVFMHTTQTPGTSDGQLNPNPAAGFALIFLKNNFNVFLGMQSNITSITATSTKIDNSALTIGQLYVISVLGNATLANWVAIGLPAGVTPAVGVPFIASAIGVPGEANTSTSRVQLPSPSTVFSIETVGQPGLTTNSNIYVNGGQYVAVQFLGPTINTGVYDSPMIPTAPANASVVNMSLYFDASSVTVDGL